MDTKDPGSPGLADCSRLPQSNVQPAYNLPEELRSAAGPNPGPGGISIKTHHFPASKTEPLCNASIKSCGKLPLNRGIS